jgi:hypothetical protein
LFGIEVLAASVALELGDLFGDFPTGEEGLQILISLKKGVEAIQNGSCSAGQKAMPSSVSGAAHVAQFVVVEFLQF